MLSEPFVESDMALILVVESDPVVRDRAALALSEVDGAEVASASTLAEAMRLVRAEPPDAVVSAVELSDGLGIPIADAVHRLRAEVPVVFVADRVEDFRDEVPTGATLLERPVSPETLMNIARAATRPHAATSASRARFTVVDYARLADTGRRSFVIEVNAPAPAGGVVYMRDGDVWAADDGYDDPGEAAFVRLCLVPARSVTCQALTHDLPRRTVFARLPELLRRAARSSGEFLDVGHTQLRTPTSEQAALADDDSEMGFGVQYQPRTAVHRSTVIGRTALVSVAASDAAPVRTKSPGAECLEQPLHDAASDTSSDWGVQETRQIRVAPERGAATPAASRAPDTPVVAVSRIVGDAPPVAPLEGAKWLRTRATPIDPPPVVQERSESTLAARGPYPPELRARIVELHRGGRTAAELAREFGPTAATIAKWVRQADLDDGLRHDGLKTEEHAELQRLRRDVRRLQREREIVGRAAALLARGQAASHKARPDR